MCILVTNQNKFSKYLDSLLLRIYTLSKNISDWFKNWHLIQLTNPPGSSQGVNYLMNWPSILSFQIRKAFEKSQEFFQLDSLVKQKYLRPKDSNHGYVQTEREGYVLYFGWFF